MRKKPKKCGAPGSSGGGSPEDTIRLECNIINGKEVKGPFLRQIKKRVEKVSYSFVKAVKCGNYLEIHEAESPFMFNRPVVVKRRKVTDNLAEYQADYRKQNMKRAKDMIRRLVLGNFTGEIKLLTLTFNNQNDFDITDISECNKKFSIFMHLLRKIYGGFKYLAVLELQKRKAVHYHILCDLPYIDKSDIANFWGFGFIDIRRTNASYEALMYILKYVHKDIGNEKTRSKRRYFASKNLIRPKKYYNDGVYKLRRKMADENRSPTFTYTLNSPENGKIFVQEYNLNETRPRKNTSDDAAK